jgi:hypothetical protein
MAKKRLSRDQKRKAKLVDRAKKHPAPSPSLAYAGNQFKRAELTPLFQSTETGIIEADAITRQTLTDRQVRAALESLVHALRGDGLGPFDPADKVTWVAGKEPDLIVHMIRINWHRRFLTFPHPGNETLVGILRTLLHSIETFTTPAPASRGYLSYVTGFLRKLGIRAQLQGVEEKEDPFEAVGEAWVFDNDAHARTEFLRQAEQMIAAGQGERVAEVALMLMGQIEMGPTLKELSHLAAMAPKSTLSLPE